MLLIGGSIAVAWQARIATREAERATRRFSDLRTLARSVLFDYHDAIKDLPGATPVRERLVKDGLVYLDRLSTEAGNDRALQRELAQGYLRMGQVQGSTMMSSLGNTTASMASLRKAASILDTLVRADSSDTVAMGDLAGVSRMIGMNLWETGDPTQGLRFMRTSAALSTEIVKRQPVAADDWLRLHASQDYLGQILAGVADRLGARRAYEASLAALDSMPPAARDSLRVRRGILGGSTSTLACCCLTWQSFRLHSTTCGARSRYGGN